MSRILIRMNTLFLATMVTFAPVYAQDIPEIMVIAEQQEEVQSQDLVIWYKKRPVQIGAALTVAVGLYAFAVYQNKIASPMGLLAVFAGLFHSSTSTKMDLKKEALVNKKDSVKDDTVSQQDGSHDVVLDMDASSAEKNIVSSIVTSVEVQSEDNPVEKINNMDLTNMDDVSGQDAQELTQPVKTLLSLVSEKTNVYFQQFANEAPEFLKKKIARFQADDNNIFLNQYN